MERKNMVSKRLSREEAAADWLKKLEESEAEDEDEGEGYDSSQLKRELKAIIDPKQTTLDSALVQVSNCVDKSEAPK
jgi:hypothetical protein